MRLLFVHEVNWREKVIYEIHDFPELLSLRGHEITFIDFGEGAARGALLELRTQVQRGLSRAHPGASIEVRTPGRILPPPFDRFVAPLAHGPALFRALARGGFDAVVLYAVPTNGWLALAIARHFRVPVMFRALDISYQLRATALGPLIRRVERFVYRRADALSTHNEPLRRYCIDNGADPERASIEPPGVDLERFAPAARDPALARRYGIGPEDRVILYMGTLYRFSGLDWLLRALAPLLAEDPRARCVVVGDGEARGSLEQLAAELGVQRSVVFTGVAGYPELADHLRLADVAVNPFRRSLVTDCALPNKVFQYLACGIPTVASPLAGLQSALPGESEGILYRELDASFVAAIRGLLGDPQRRARLGRDGRAALERRFRWEDCAARFEDAIRRMLEERRGRAK